MLILPTISELHTSQLPSVITVQSVVTYMEHFHADEFETLLLEPLDDLPNDAPLHAVGLDCDKCAFISHDSKMK